MNRPEARNAQNLQMTYDLNAAFDAAVQDDPVKVIILAGNGPHFSAGHDLRPGARNAAGVDFPALGHWGGFNEPNAHGRFAREQEIYLQITRRWRNLAKPMIAEVHGKCIAGGLMLAWACDLIVASVDAEFCDPVVTMGVCGVEWFVHPWELGPRKAKIGKCARFVAEQAVQLHGGMGVTEELDIGAYFKRLLAFDTLFGSSAHHIRRHAALGGRAMRS
jgi:enoyl-CoA hydratase